MKSIRNIEASVQPSRDRKQKITDQIAQLKYKEPNSPRIVVLEQELVRAEAESLVAEAQLSNITREKLKAAFVKQLFKTKNLKSVLGTFSINAAGDTTLTSYGLYKLAPTSNGKTDKLTFYKTLKPTKYLKAS